MRAHEDDIRKTQRDAIKVAKIRDKHVRYYVESAMLPSSMLDEAIDDTDRASEASLRQLELNARLREAGMQGEESYRESVTDYRRKAIGVINSRRRGDRTLDEAVALEAHVQNEVEPQFAKNWEELYRKEQELHRLAKKKMEGNELAARRLEELRKTAKDDEENLQKRNRGVAGLSKATPVFNFNSAIDAIAVPQELLSHVLGPEPTVLIPKYSLLGELGMKTGQANRDTESRHLGLSFLGVGFRIGFEYGFGPSLNSFDESYVYDPIDHSPPKAFEFFRVGVAKDFEGRHNWKSPRSTAARFRKMGGELYKSASPITINSEIFSGKYFDYRKEYDMVHPLAEIPDAIYATAVLKLGGGFTITVDLATLLGGWIGAALKYINKVVQVFSLELELVARLTLEFRFGVKWSYPKPFPGGTLGTTTHQDRPSLPEPLAVHGHIVADKAETVLMSRLDLLIQGAIVINLIGSILKGKAGFRVEGTMITEVLPKLKITLKGVGSLFVSVQIDAFLYKYGREWTLPSYPLTYETNSTPSNHLLPVTVQTAKLLPPSSPLADRWDSDGYLLSETYGGMEFKIDRDRIVFLDGNAQGGICAYAGTWPGSVPEPLPASEGAYRLALHCDGGGQAWAAVLVGGEDADGWPAGRVMVYRQRNGSWELQVDQLRPDLPDQPVFVEAKEGLCLTWLELVGNNPAAKERNWMCISLDEKTNTDAVTILANTRLMAVIPDVRGIAGSLGLGPSRQLFQIVWEDGQYRSEWVAAGPAHSVVDLPVPLWDENGVESILWFRKVPDSVKSELVISREVAGKWSAPLVLAEVSRPSQLRVITFFDGSRAVFWLAAGEQSRSVVWWLRIADNNAPMHAPQELFPGDPSVWDEMQIAMQKEPFQVGFVLFGYEEGKGLVLQDRVVDLKGNIS